MTTGNDPLEMQRMVIEQWAGDDPEGLARLAALTLLLNGDKLRELLPADAANAVLRDAAAMIGTPQGEQLRRVTLSAGGEVLIDADDPHTDEQIIEACRARRTRLDGEVDAE